MNEQIKAVIFDIGGVLVPSPVKTIIDYAHSKGLSPSTFVKTVVRCSADSAWARWERAELNMESFGREFTKECCQESGLDVDLHDFPHIFERALKTLQPHPELMTAISRLREIGYKTAILSNNMVLSDGLPIQPIDRSLFDHVVESARVRMRKPESRIYHLVLELLDTKPHESLFLDDLHDNVLAAESLGLNTIRVTSLDQALHDLQKTLGVQLVD